ncbi:serine protease family S33 [Thraustotheca clavata]|uniref:Serine protease family S33 n=1 Tax=Thraustotheca clavata TaxID=74557 RepID=A0A1V9ZCX1_9STRA|nr:serine protease family S33 [Thraustotheca clavata]
MWRSVAFGTAAIVAVPLLILWSIVGYILSRPLGVAAVISVVVVLALTTAAEVHERLVLFDFVAVLAVAFGALVLLPKKALHESLVLGAFLAYAISRRVCLTIENEKEKTYADWITVLSCVGLAWGFVCAQKYWIPARLEELTKLEDKLYKTHIMTEYKMLKVGGLGTVHIPYCGEQKDESRLPPLNLVLIHGYAAGNAFWATNLQTLAKQYNVYAVEWIGIGRSDRPDPSYKSYEDADRFFVDAIERWRKEIQLDQFVLAGHSMGGIFVTHYALKYPQNVEQLILISPAGVGYPPKDNSPRSFFFRVIRYGWGMKLTPMSFVRFMGPFGKRLVRWILQRRMSWLPDTSVLKTGVLDSAMVAEYMYHNWALKKSGEVAIHTHLLPGAYGIKPLRDDLLPNQIQMPVTFIYGGGSDWMNFEYGQEVVDRLSPTQYATLKKVPYAGHQVFMDNSADFNSILIESITLGTLSK